MPSIDAVSWVTQYKLNIIAGLTQKRPTFFYATGTSYLLNMFGLDAITAETTVVKGLKGKTAVFKGAISNDPFPQLVDPLKWNVVKIGYPAAVLRWPTLTMLDSINDGIIKTVTAINALPKGTPFALGGYSQGAAVMSLVVKNHLQTHTGNLGLPNITSRYADLKAGVMFGNPCRKTNDLWKPFNGYAGGSVSKTTDNPTGTTGGHGCFPSSYRLTTVPTGWQEFVGGSTDQLDIITCCGDGTIGTNFQAAAGVLLEQGLAGVLAALAGSVVGFTSAMIQAVQDTVAFGANGHTACPFQSPPGYSASAPTSYQIALEYLDTVGAQLRPAATVIPNSDLGGSLPAVGAGAGSGKPQFKPVTPYTVPSRPPTTTRSLSR